MKKGNLTYTPLMAASGVKSIFIPFDPVVSDQFCISSIRTVCHDYYIKVAGYVCVCLLTAEPIWFSYIFSWEGFKIFLGRVPPTPEYKSQLENRWSVVMTKKRKR